MINASPNFRWCHFPLLTSPQTLAQKLTQKVAWSTQKAIKIKLADTGNLSYTCLLTFHVQWLNKVVHVPVTDCSCPNPKAKAQPVLRSAVRQSSLNRNSHLVNITDATCGHQWTVADNVVQPAGHNSYENIQCCACLRNHCPSDHGMRTISHCWKVLCCYCSYFFQTALCYLFWCNLIRWVKWTLWVANIVGTGSLVQTTNSFFCTHSLSSPVSFALLH